MSYIDKIYNFTRGKSGPSTKFLEICPNSKLYNRNLDIISNYIKNKTLKICSNSL